MLFCLFCIDKPGVEDKRKAATRAHIDYLGTNPIKIVMSGPLVSDDGAHIIGSLYVVDAPDRAAVAEFQRNDPLAAADLWQTVEVRAFVKRLDNRD
jgi:uncharacterized protein